MVTSILEAAIPELRGHIFGEENALFRSADGRTISVRLMDSVDETQALLEMLLPNNTSAAAAMAAAAHALPDLGSLVESLAQASMEGTFDPHQLAVWIDPIDCTSAYVAGGTGDFSDGVLTVGGGLPAVTVLIGCYDRGTGEPLAGVIYQPFSPASEQGRCTWGVVPKNGVPRWGVLVTEKERSVYIHVAPPGPCGVRWAREQCCVPDAEPSGIMVHSKHEAKSVLAALARCGDLRAAPGAGYKLLCVIDGTARCFVTSVVRYIINTRLVRER